MPPHGTGPLIKCNDCEHIIRKSKINKHQSTYCHRQIPSAKKCEKCKETISPYTYRVSVDVHNRMCSKRMMECQYCHETVIISELVLHTSKCTSLSELIDKYPDCLEHASTYGIGASLLAIPGKFRLIRIVRMMDILLHMHAFGLPRGSELRNQLEWNVKKEKLGLLVLMCAKQFNDRKLYKLLFRRFFCEYKEPKQCVIEDLHLILGNNINILHVGSLLENSGLRVEYDIDFCLSPISCGRLYCNHNKISNIEFVKDYGGFLQLRHVVRDESMQLISKDVSGIIMEYSFAAQVVVNSY